MSIIFKNIIDEFEKPTFMKKGVEAENVGLSVRSKLDEYEPYIKSKEFRKTKYEFYSRKRSFWI